MESIVFKSIVPSLAGLTIYMAGATLTDHSGGKHYDPRVRTKKSHEIVGYRGIEMFGNFQADGNIEGVFKIGRNSTKFFRRV
jgi:hypothetical protein